MENIWPIKMNMLIGKIGLGDDVKQEGTRELSNEKLRDFQTRKK